MSRNIALVLLAAGRASRFGGGKLAALLGGKPVIEHVAAATAALPVAQRILVAAPDVPALPGFTRVALDPPQAPQSRSLALGIAAAPGADSVLIALADMPLVPAAHFATMLAAFDGDRLTSSCNGQPLPPALLGAQHFPALLALTGDRGAGALLRDAPALALTAEQALDIDTPEDLARAAALLPPPSALRAATSPEGGG
ncbi:MULTISPECIES: nucleotidyltransferase family protein [unclassified Novosphingobium]|uniref:nucleotidyltransferase family protein n=1 Tax=unclassified Novosphingobium TaxID=2644732 RepID=UPI001493F6B6|nr:MULTISPECIES: nucleotidyltransferase family protein [unclassified Novosphingobium]MBB3360228.1 molybdenum cofactor cytidylyltransferase [Novosphingobium sp. BK256]MBB3376509.1 molybdenum cofactor cytidylyltransferase [Novosphingobium sp. BK280]MBB3380922.1 molybdenum cofactor cytidylyltransferase [Novosphingobium sp. BK258]MBB3422573.1 molybdenum cofactor cytidylyltransferase [Novosphingobium sp. BK267]MBB3451274.1 molybdenum cofactor cytidylyltransferase [Novosphingobium sp. BK352]